MSALAKAVMAFDRRYPGAPDAELIIPAQTWLKWVELARREHLDDLAQRYPLWIRPTPPRPAPPVLGPLTAEPSGQRGPKGAEGPAQPARGAAAAQGALGLEVHHG